MLIGSDPLDAQFWPYTLDHGVSNNCLEQPDICQGRLKLPGLWEIPMARLALSHNIFATSRSCVSTREFAYSLGEMLD